MEEIKKELLKLINEVSVEKQIDNLDVNVNLSTELHFDSVNYVMLLSKMEEAFDIFFDAEDMDYENMSETDELIRLVEEKMKE